MKKKEIKKLLLLFMLMNSFSCGQNEIISKKEIANSGFENENDKYWKYDSQNSKVTQETFYDGNRSLSVGNENEYSCEIYQKIDSLEEGYYYLEAYTLNDGGQDYCYIYGQGSTQGRCMTSVPKKINNKWTKVTIRGIHVNGDGKLTIGISSKGKNQYCYFDSISLHRENVQKKYDLSLGGAISWLNWEEDSGAKYYTSEGVENDPLQIMSENGCNLVRLELYNNPGEYVDENGYSFPKGYKDENDILDLALRAKNKGMGIQLSFMYSDYWGNDIIPSDWKKEISNLTNYQQITNILKNKVYEFTKSFMNKLKENDIYPEYVSLGNEMECGILLPYGDSTNESTLSTFCAFMEEGYKAVKEVSPTSKIILHTASNADDMFWENKQGKGTWFFDLCKNNNIKYDVIGTSFYPFWAQTDSQYAVKKKLDVNDLVSWCNLMIDRYDKDVFIMESAINWGKPGQLANNGAYEGIYSYSPEDQKNFMYELINGIKSVKDGRCLGDLYWDPILVKQSGIGYAINNKGIQVPNVVETTTFFDYSHKALPVLKAYKYNTFLDDGRLYGTIKDNEGKILSNQSFSIKLNGIDINIHTDKYGYYIVKCPSYKGKIDFENSSYNVEVNYGESVNLNLIKKN